MFAIFPFFMTPKTFWPISGIEESFEEGESFLLAEVWLAIGFLVMFECWDKEFLFAIAMNKKILVLSGYSLFYNKQN